MGLVPHDGISAFIRRRERETSPHVQALSKGHVNTQQSTNQKKDPHQEPDHTGTLISDS